MRITAKDKSTTTTRTNKEAKLTKCVPLDDSHLRRRVWVVGVEDKVLNESVHKVDEDTRAAHQDTARAIQACASAKTKPKEKNER
jgi:hypothetical protein